MQKKKIAEFRETQKNIAFNQKGSIEWEWWLLFPSIYFYNKLKCIILNSVICCYSFFTFSLVQSTNKFSDFVSKWKKRKKIMLNYEKKKKKYKYFTNISLVYIIIPDLMVYNLFSVLFGVRIYMQYICSVLIYYNIYFTFLMLRNKLKGFRCFFFFFAVSISLVVSLSRCAVLYSVAFV